jgi:hypothetical protein
MAYTIIRSDGSVLTTIQDGTIDTTHSSLGLPGRNYAGYGQSLDTNFVRMVENFSNDSPPANPLRGQLWFNTNDSTMRYCPTDGENVASSWVILNTTTSQGNTSLGNVTVTGNVLANNITTTNDIGANTITVLEATATGNLTAANAVITTGNIVTLTTQTITTGATSTQGSITGTWRLEGTSSANGLTMANSNIAFNSASYGIKCDNYMNADGSPFTPAGTYNDDNVSDYLTGTNDNGTNPSLNQFVGNIAPNKVTTSQLAGGGTISGVWTLASGARIQATYADLAERYEADATYDVGTVVELGGDKEITESTELSENVFGVVSDSYAYLLNAGAGPDETHPPIAISGRIKVKVVGPVKKGQRLVAAGKGKARAASQEELTPFNTIGRALENKTSSDEGTVKAIVIIK